MRGFDINDRTVVLGLVTAYAVGALIVLAVLVHTAVWPIVLHSL